MDRTAEDTRKRFFIKVTKTNAEDCIRKQRNHNQTKKRCLRGHLFNEANTYSRPDEKRKERQCRICRKKIRRKFYEKHKR